jgi:nitroreductase
MDLFETIQKRQSVRAYHSKGIEPAKLETLLGAVNQAPSAGNLQARQIIVVRDEATRHALARASLGQDFISQAPVALVFCADAARAATKYGKRGREFYSVQDATIAASYAQLAATALGLATCWVGAFEEKEVVAVLGLRADLRPVAILPVGYAAESPRRTPRRALGEVVVEHAPTRT